MIEDVKHLEIFPVDVFRIVLALDHAAITEYTLEHKKKWNQYTTYHNHEINRDWQKNLPDRKKLEESLIEVSDRWNKKTGRKLFSEYGDGAFLHYWVSVYSENDQHGSHNHPGSSIAGTYYPSCGMDSASINFEAPWDAHTMHDTIDFSKKVYKYRPQIGDALIWPSWLYHRVQTQGPSDVPRIAISFNLDYNKYHD
jgi:uncharacterized protein (TIGR02466 family)